MTSKHRLVDTSRNPLARELLRSADLDEPPEHSAVRLAVALGLGSSALVSTIAAGAEAATGTALAAAAATTKGVGLAATGAGTTLGANAVAGVATVSGAVASNAAAGMGIAAGSATLVSGAGFAATGAAAPVVGSALSAVGMLKAMAVVSLACGALSFGGTKLAMNMAESQESATVQSPSVQKVTAAPKRVFARAKTATAPVQEGATPPPPPAAPDEEEDDDDVVPTLGQDPRLANVASNPQLAAPERNVGRQDTNQDPNGTVVDDGSNLMQQSMAAAELATAPGVGATRQAAVAAFPSDDDRAPAVSGAPPEKRTRTRAKMPKAEPETDHELEIVLLNRARGAVVAGQPLVALQALELYRTQAPHGSLRAESVILHIEALLALGQRSAAERIAIPFIKAAPQSHQAARARQLLGLPSESP